MKKFLLLWLTRILWFFALVALAVVAVSDYPDKDNDLAYELNKASYMQLEAIQSTALLAFYVLVALAVATWLLGQYSSKPRKEKPGSGSKQSDETVETGTGYGG